MILKIYHAFKASLNQIETLEFSNIDRLKILSNKILIIPRKFKRMAIIGEIPPRLIQYDISELITAKERIIKTYPKFYNIDYKTKIRNLIVNNFVSEELPFIATYDAIDKTERWHYEICFVDDLAIPMGEQYQKIVTDNSMIVMSSSILDLVEFDDKTQHFHFAFDQQTTLEWQFLKLGE